MYKRYVCMLRDSFALVIHENKNAKNDLHYETRFKAHGAL